MIIDIFDQKQQKDKEGQNFQFLRLSNKKKKQKTNNKLNFSTIDILQRKKCILTSGENLC